MKTKYAIPLAIAIMCGILWLVVLVVDAMAVKPEQWLKRNRAIAQPYAEAVLAGQQPAIPGALAASVSWSEAGTGAVYFVLSGGPLSSAGMAYSTTGEAPRNGLAGESRVLRWKQIEDNWYKWSAD